MKIEAIEVEIRNLMDKVRKRQIELDEYRQKNTQLIESIMSNKTQESICDDICLLANNWVQSYLNFQIIGLKAKVKEIEQEMEEGKNEEQIKLLEKEIQRNKALKENKESLLVEFKSLQEELEKEKIELKSFIKNNN